VDFVLRNFDCARHIRIIDHAPHHPRDLGAVVSGEKSRRGHTTTSCGTARPYSGASAKA
jgi:hypothetical protein